MLGVGEPTMTHSQVEQQMVCMMMYNIKSIYANHSSDEYKMSGDITRSPDYNHIEKLITDLRTLKGYPKNEAQDISDMFSTLHRPIFKETVTAYLVEPNDRNTLYTAMFTVGYRVLVGELARIYASTQATDSGMIYLPDKISRRNDIAPFIRSFNKDLTKRIDEYIASKHEGTTTMKEAFEIIDIDENDYLALGEVMLQEGVGTKILTVINTIADTIFGGIDWVFKGFKEINPISFINACLMHSYQKKVDNFHNTAAMYEETKKAYDNYMKLPESKRNPKVVEKYKRNIEKYNIAMENQKARIADYDQRAQEERDQQASEFPKVDVNSGPNAPEVPDMYDEPAEETAPEESAPADDDFGF